MAAHFPVLAVPEMFGASYDALPQVLWLADQAGRICGANLAWEDYTGLARAAGPGQSFLELLHPDDREPARAAWVAAGAEARAFRAEVRLRRHDGAYHSFLAQSRPPPEAMSAGQLRAVVCTDIHDGVQERRNLANRAAMLQDIVDANADCIKLLSPDARLLSMNVGGMRVMDVDDFNTCLNAVWPEFWQGETRPLVEAALAQARAGGTGQFEGACPTLKGTLKWWNVTITPIRDDTGQIVNLLATSRDITGRRLAEEKLRDLNAGLEARIQARTRELDHLVEQLQRSNTELERFAYVAAHDLQEPIRTVSSFAGLLGLRYSGSLDARGQSYLDFVQSGALRMKTLVDDLLAYSRLSHQQPALSALSLDGPLGEALSRLDSQLAEHGAVVTHGALPTVLGDGPQLAQVLQNLLGNAVKFARPGVPPRIHLTAARDGPHWRLSLSDNGLGIEPLYLNRIFEMFQRLHTRDQIEGTGLGLSISRKIVEAHGGQLWAESIPGQGSTFHFTLRAAPGGTG